MATAAANAAAPTVEYELEAGSHGPGDLEVLKFEAEERLSTPFELDVTVMIRPGVDVDVPALLGEPAALHAEAGDGEVRDLHGMVARVRAWEEGTGEDRKRLRLTVVPRLWRLGKMARSRIFQNLTVPQIVEKVLKEGEVEHRLSLAATYPERRYCVQYRESDLDFVSRLLEEEGIFYLFEHAAGGHVMVLGDAPSAHQPLPGGARLAFREKSSLSADADHADAFSAVRELRSGKMTLRDYDDLRPALDLTASKASGGDEEKLEVYDYPAGHHEPKVGEARARVRLEAERAWALQHAGSSTCKRLVPGYVLELADHPLPELNGEYVVLSVTHRGHQRGRLAAVEAHALDKESYRNQFTCLKKDVPFRPVRRTPRPVIPGAQTAVVVGPSGEEIHTDEHGRIKVQFHWDREGKHDDRASCWIRVAQSWAGPGWGALYLPRMGQEVVV